MLTTHERNTALVAGSQAARVFILCKYLRYQLCSFVLLQFAILDVLLDLAYEPTLLLQYHVALVIGRSRRLVLH